MTNRKKKSETGKLMVTKVEISPDYSKHTREWINIALLVVFISALMLSFGIGLRVGSERGEEHAMQVIMDRIHANLDSKCFDQLANNLGKGKK